MRGVAIAVVTFSIYVENRIARIIIIIEILNSKRTRHKRLKLTYAYSS